MIIVEYVTAVIFLKKGGILKKKYKKEVTMALLGNPFVGNVPKQMNMGELIQALRVDIAGELEAIIGYEAHAMATDDMRVKKVLTHIADEERQHAGELQQLLYLLSPNDMEKMEKGRQEVMTQQQSNFQAAMQ